MGRLETIRENSRWRDLFEGQYQHAVITILMVAGVCSLLKTSENPERFLGLTTTGWAMVSVWLAVIHQSIVAIVFRLQLHKNLMTRLFGEKDMRVWAVIFLPLLAARPLSMIMVGLSDTVPITNYPNVALGVGIALLVPAIWGMHSTLVHFTLRRALGGDHFRNEIADMPLVTKGVFKYTNNGMYGVVFLGLWGIALLFNSWNTLIVALFQHAYIWVHMAFTETPDMRRIYEPTNGTS